MSDNLCATQEQEWKEIEEWIAECTRHIDDFRVSYQSLIDDIDQSKVVSKTVKDVIASARMTITKSQALIQYHELNLANEKRKVEELETTKHRMQKEVNDHSSKLEALRIQQPQRNFYQRRI